MLKHPVIVIENDQSLRLLQAFLDATPHSERTAALADYLAHDLPDFPGWLECARRRAQGAYPAEVRMVSTQDELIARLPGADAFVTEGLAVGSRELAVADRLKVVQKHGVILRNIDVPACAARGVKVVPLRRRGNMTAAEHIFSLMLGLARKLTKINGLITTERLTAAGYRPQFFDRRYSPNANWARIGGLRSLHGATLGIVGLGEIGREVALRAIAFGMRTNYYQRSRLPEAEKRALGIEHRDFDALLGGSDWVCCMVPGEPATRGLFDGARLARMKPGACLVNVSRADVVDREAAVAALKSGRLGGLGQDAFYEEPGRADDPLLAFDNVIITPRVASQPRLNALDDTEEMMVNLARAIA
ncbi:MAG: D-glycerate dehydrogenase [Betaproteobacteria bacterium]|nr:D-glycerate dehydrogenase [Betaproteobacteria bacterium]